MNSVPEEYSMEAGTSVLLDSCQEESMLMETVKNIVGANGQDEEEEEDGEEEGQEDEEEEEDDPYFAVEEIPNEQDRQMDISIRDAEDATKQAEQRIWLERCRVCANHNDHLIPIFEGEGLEHELCSKIHKHLPIQVCEGDSLPLQLCYHCAATLLAWHELAEGCLDAERRLVQMQCDFQQKQQFFQSAAVNCPLDGLSETAADEVVSVIDRREQLPQQNQEFETKGLINEESTTNDSERSTNHDRSSRISSFNAFQKACRALRRSYQSQVRYPPQSLRRKGKSNQHPDTVSLGSGSDHKNTVKTNGSSLIGIRSEERSVKQEKHVPQNSSSNAERSTRYVSGEKNSKMGRFSCSVCEKSFSRQTVLDKHTSAAHAIAPCMVLKKEDSFTDESDSAEPEFPPVLTTNPYDCKLCGKKFRLQESFRTHMRIHTGEKPFTCHICGKQFGQTGSLYYHLKHVHGGVKNHSCDICGRSFAMKAAMEDHRRIHTGERPYICASCGKTFKTKASLYIHSKTHTDEFPYKCTYCTKVFRWRQQMLGHLTIHTGEKNHMCDVCGKGFGVKNDLTRHKRTHSGEKPYVCQQCGISFGQKRYLKSHERARHK